MSVVHLSENIFYGVRDGGQPCCARAHRTNAAAVKCLAKKTKPRARSYSYLRRDREEADPRREEAERDALRAWTGDDE